MPAKKSDARRLCEYVQKGWEFHIIEMFHDLMPVEIAELIEELDDETRVELFRLLDVETASEVIAELSSESREDVIDEMSDSDLAQIVEEMDSDDAADLVAEMEDGRAERVLAAMDPQDSSDIKALLEYGEDTAGGLMQHELVSVPITASVDEAIAQIRLKHAEIENIHKVFVVDQKGCLVGDVDLIPLILNRPETPIEQLMDSDPLSVPVEMDQEEVAREFRKYDAVVMPVVDENGQLLGRITIDDVVDVMEEEAAEDMFMLAGAAEDLLTSSIFKNASTRMFWLAVCWLGGVVNSIMIRNFESTLAQLVGLAAFMPIVLGMGGNVGSQSVTMVVRGIATGLIDTLSFYTLLLKQIGVGALLGGIFGAMLSLVVYFLYHGSLHMSLVVGISIFNSMTLASLVGTLMPVCFYKLGKDPAVASGPLMSTFMDMIGVVAYFGVALVLLF